MEDTFFSTNSFMTLLGCVTTVIAVLNTIRHVFNWGPRWFGLILSVIVSIVAFILIHQAESEQKEISIAMYDIVIIVLNGCLIYTSAFGLQNNIISKIGSRNASFQSVEDNSINWNNEW